jgi:hypothetical protein
VSDSAMESESGLRTSAELEPDIIQRTGEPESDVSYSFYHRDF